MCRIEAMNNPTFLVFLATVIVVTIALIAANRKPK